MAAPVQLSRALRQVRRRAGLDQRDRMIVAIGGWAAFAWLGLTAMGVGLLIVRLTLGAPFSTHTLTHSIVETVDALSSLALVPVVVAVFQLCGPSLLSSAGAVAGLAGLLLSALLDVLFALGVLTFGVGASLPWLVVGTAAVLVWLVLAGWSLIRTRALPAYLGWLTVATGVLVMIPVPVWAVLLGRGLLRAARNPGQPQTRR
jgi:hypothetical protein